MAKLFFALCFFSSLLAVALADDSFTIQGRVYCDTCRAGFETSVTEYIADAKIAIECKNYSNNQVTQKVEGQCDKSGTYNVVVKDVHDQEICEAMLVSSPRDDCKEIKQDRSRARIVLTHDSGISSTTRYPNSLGFYINTPLPVCGKLLQEYGLSDVLDS